FAALHRPDSQEIAQSAENAARLRYAKTGCRNTVPATLPLLSVLPRPDAPSSNRAKDPSAPGPPLTQIRANWRLLALPSQSPQEPCAPADTKRPVQPRIESLASPETRFPHPQ